MTDVNIYTIIFLSPILYIFVAAILGHITNSFGAEFVNPTFLYETLRVNWFGAFFLAVIFNLLTVPVAIVYWIYKLCTVGRR